MADIGLVGLAVMGQNLALNMADKGFNVVVFNRTTSKVDDFMKGLAKGKTITAAYSLKEFFSKLKLPRRVILMVKAGKAVDELIDKCLPFLEERDILIDGGNSHFLDSNNRFKFLKEKKILYVGAGISGGEVGARYGPSIMIGGNRDAWPHLKGIFLKIAAKAGDGTACCEWLGEGGVGHFVKMVHNGIEYADMEIIAESFDLLKSVLEMGYPEISEIYRRWNQEELNSYLLEITSEILNKKENDSFVVDSILDVAHQKGTGVWTAISSLQLGIDASVIANAVFVRILSLVKEERKEAQEKFEGPTKLFSGDRKHFINEIKAAFYAARIITYSQGFTLMKRASEEYGWHLDLKTVALIWRGGCIIRSALLDRIAEAFNKNPNLSNLVFDDFLAKELIHHQAGLRSVVVRGAMLGVPLFCISSALSFFDGYRAKELPTYLIQAQRDFFGAHTYEKKNEPRGRFFHTQW